ncbi:alpha/beta hydrolase [uncultured Aquimarina sp.]|uniref:alpha/beta hydrolase n=1 Tax=uncultured Aquimarina sp. TaxID=575652 RepID=UPI0026038450|nr:alpha/beta hydrolase [uncultured Aquimarina sp.]
MKKTLKILIRLIGAIVILLISIICYIRFSRTLDPYIYRATPSKGKFTSLYKHQELMLDLEDNTKIHAAIFSPDSAKIKATIFHHLGNGMDLNTAQLTYKTLLQDGYQIFAYERRGFGESTGDDNDSSILKKDAIEIFDAFKKMDKVKGTDIIIWGVSLGGIFATTNAAERNSDIKGLILEGTFSSFPDVAKHYASEINLENYKWLIPLLLNNDFPTNKEIKKVTKPIVIIHSTEDKLIPFKLGENIFNNSNKSNTTFWKIKGAHVKGILNYEQEYLEKFNQILNH